MAGVEPEGRCPQNSRARECESHCLTLAEGIRKAIDRGGMMQDNRLDTHQKAVQINLDNTKYGTFAEIGAGQEVARWFFRVGGAAGHDRQEHLGLRHDRLGRDLRRRRPLRQPPAPRDDARLRISPHDRAPRRRRGARTPGSSCSPTPSPPRATRARTTGTAGWASGSRPPRRRAVADHPARQPAGPRDDLAARGHRHPGRQPDPRRALRGRRRPPWSGTCSTTSRASGSRST